MRCLAAVLAAVAVVVLVAVGGGAASPSTSASFFLTGKIPGGWTKMEAVPAEEEVAIVFAVKRKNLDQLTRVVNEVSDPTHPNWGKHMTLDEVNELTSDWEATGVVMSWLLANDVPGDRIVPTRGGNFLHVTIPAGLANRVLSASFSFFQHDRTGVVVKRTPIYRLPAAVSRSVDFVSASTLFPRPRPAPVRRRAEMPMTAEGGIPAGFVQPSTLIKAYGITSTTVATAQSTQSVYENLDQSYDENDVKLFQQTFNLASQKIAKVIGPNTPSDCTSNPDNCGEALLDVEWIMAMAQGAPTTYWSIANSDQTPFLDWIIAVGNDNSAPLVHSVSYGEVEQDMDASIMQRFCTEVQTLGARGITVMVASGDDGVANFPARGDASKCGFYPSYPATCPYVTAVGATMGPENSQPEVACTSAEGGEITSGGGFSTVFTAPSWQSGAISNYLQNGPNVPPTSQFASGGRGYPDVAVLGHNYVMALQNQLTAASGTSASSPVFASMITLINGLRIQAGKSPLGFLNQILYQFAQNDPTVFNDITSGENNCAAGGGEGEPAPTCCQYGFTAGAGWDPITGLGSVNFNTLSDALQALP